MTNDMSIPMPENQVQAQGAPIHSLTADELDRIRQDTAKDSFKAGYEKARKEISVPPQMQPQQSDQTPYQAPPTQAQMAPQMNNGFQQQGQPDVQSVVAQELQRQLAQQQAQLQQAQSQQMAQKTLTELGQKIQAVAPKYPDYEKVVTGAGFDQMPEIFEYANLVPNSAETLYHLAQHPEKVGSILALHDRGARGQALQAMNKVASSLQMNDAASNLPKTNEPLSQLTPSTVGGNGTKPSMGDLKAHYRF